MRVQTSVLRLNECRFLHAVCGHTVAHFVSLAPSHFKLLSFQKMEEFAVLSAGWPIRKKAEKQPLFKQGQRF